MIHSVHRAKREREKMIQVTVYNTRNYEIVCRVTCTSYKEAAVYEDYYTRKGFYVEVA